jgi:recombinational DNA repair protein (RecF pathway)
VAKIDPQDAEAFMLNAGYKPLEPYSKSHQKWKCIHLACGETVFPSYHSLKQGQGGCFPCGRKAGADKKRLSETETVQMMLNANLQPLEPYKDSNTPWKSRCLVCSEEVQPRFSAIKVGQGGCGFCSGNFVNVSTAKNRMKQANLFPLVEYTKSHDKWKSKCLLCGRVVFPTYNSIQQGNGGCKHCSKKFVIAEEAEKLMLSKGLKPLEPYSKANYKWKCKCLICEKIVMPSYSSILRGNGGCKYCAGMIIDSKTAIALMESVHLRPLVPFTNGHTKWKCECLVCGKIVYQSYNQMHQGFGPCGYCAGKVVDVQDAIKIMQSAGLKPLDPYSKALDKWKCECLTCGRVVHPTYSAIKKGQGGCRFCAQIGIDYTGPGFIYLMTHQHLQSHKIGIGGSRRSRNRDRVIEHQKFGWKLHSRKDFETADDAFQVEQKVLIWLRQEMKLGVFLSESEMPQGGHTETVDASEIDLPTIWAKVEELSKVKR